MALSSPNVLIIRLDRIGDALALTPLLAALRERRIPVDLVLCDENAQAFAPGAVRSVEIAASLRSAASLKRRNYSHVLVATEDASGYRLARYAGAPSRVGFANGLGKPLKTLWVRTVLTQTLYRPARDLRGIHECNVLYELGRTLVGDEQPSQDSAVLRTLILREVPPRSDRVALQITGKWLRSGAALSDVVSLVKRVRKGSGVQLIAAGREARFADEVAVASGTTIELFDSLEPWKDAIASAKALIAPDSGATHVAGMVGTPVVAGFPDRLFDVQVARWHPWAAPYRAVRLVDGWVQRTVAALNDLS